MLAPRILLLSALSSFATFSIACSDSSDDDDDASDEGAISRTAHTVLESNKDARGNAATFAFRYETIDGKRTPVVGIKRDGGEFQKDLVCSQAANIHDDEAKDEVVTVCEEKIRPGVEYLSVYFRFRPAAKTFTYDVIASHPTSIPTKLRNLFRVIAGRDVETPPLAGPEPYRNHREEALKLPLSTKELGTNPFSDPIALAAAVNEGMRAPLGEQVPDRANNRDFTVDTITTYTDFDTLIYAVHMHGSSAGPDVRRLSNLKMKVGALESPNKLLSTAKLKAEIRRQIAAL